MRDDLVARLREGNGQGCTCHADNYDECGCGNGTWAEAHIGEAADEIERLQADRTQCHEDFLALKDLFDKMRDDRNRWRDLADELYFMLETGSTREECEAMDKYEKTLEEPTNHE